MGFLGRSFLIVSLIGLAPPGDCRSMVPESPLTSIGAGSSCHHSPQAPCCRQPNAPCCEEAQGGQVSLSKDPTLLPHYPQGAIPSTRIIHDPTLIAAELDPVIALSLFQPKGHSILKL